MHVYYIGNACSPGGTTWRRCYGLAYWEMEDGQYAIISPRNMLQTYSRQNGMKIQPPCPPPQPTRGSGGASEYLELEKNTWFHFPWLFPFSLTTLEFSDFSRFSRRVVTLCMVSWWLECKDDGDRVKQSNVCRWRLRELNRGIHTCTQQFNGHSPHEPGLAGCFDDNNGC